MCSSDLWVCTLKSTERGLRAHVHHLRPCGALVLQGVLSAHNVHITTDRDQTDDPMDKKVRAETKEFGDILRLDSTDTCDSAPNFKTPEAHFAWFRCYAPRKARVCACGSGNRCSVPCTSSGVPCGRRYADLAHKTLKLFSKLPDKFDASFYFKVRQSAALDPRV